MKLTQDEVLFLKRHKISEDDVLDAQNISSSDRKNKAKKLGKHFMLRKPPCQKGNHRIFTRNNHCIQCDTSKIAIQLRGSKTGFVYLAGSESKKLIKVGVASDLSDREKTLNSFKYADCNDWVILKWIKVDNAGTVEGCIHHKLLEYASPQKYYKEGRWQDTYEIFTCSFLTALKALSDEIKDRVLLDEKKIDTQFFQTYCNFPNARGEGHKRTGNIVQC